jgi:hypothetical protein
LIHLKWGSFGSNDNVKIPTNGSTTEAAMTHNRMFFTRRVKMPTTRKTKTDTTLLGIPTRRTWSWVKPKDAYMMLPKVVRPPESTRLSLVMWDTDRTHRWEPMRGMLKRSSIFCV